MPESCTVCSRPDRNAIDTALSHRGTSLRDIAGQFGVPKSSLHRHKKHAAQVRESASLIEKLPPKKQRYVEGVVAGRSRKQAALDAGFTQAMATHPGQKIETADVREAFSALIREVIPAEKIAKTIAAGIEANETKFFSHEGKVEDEREVIAWSERRQYAELAAEYGGYKPAAKDEGAHGGGVLIILPGPDSEVRTAQAKPVIEGEMSPGPMVTLPGENQDA